MLHATIISYIHNKEEMLRKSYLRWVRGSCFVFYKLNATNRDLNSHLTHYFLKHVQQHMIYGRVNQNTRRRQISFNFNYLYSMEAKK
uniref:Putative ovule protein n=1 Tax=Solanum chacoense TaxID=4108 RepID=A0A0V0IGM2_SOLCH